MDTTNSFFITLFNLHDCYESKLVKMCEEISDKCLIVFHGDNFVENPHFRIVIHTKVHKPNLRKMFQRTFTHGKGKSNYSLKDYDKDPKKGKCESSCFHELEVDDDIIYSNGYTYDEIENARDIQYQTYMNKNTPPNLIEEVVDSFLSHEHFHPSYKEVFERICSVSYFNEERNIPERVIIDKWITRIKMNIAKICDSRYGGNFHSNLAFEEWYNHVLCSKR